MLLYIKEHMFLYCKEVELLKIPKELLLPGCIPNVVINDLSTNEKVVLFAVDYDSDLVLLGPLEGRSHKDWIEMCWIENKEQLLVNYEIYDSDNGV